MTKQLSQSEFTLASRAKNGDLSANIELWERYKPVAISLLKPVPGMTVAERISEGYDLFLHKLDIFDPAKVRSPDLFTFSYMMTGGLKNRRHTLFTQFKRDSANVSFIPFDEDSVNSLDRVYRFMVIKNYETEIACEKLNINLFLSGVEDMFAEKSLEEKESILFLRLNDFQKEILKLKQEGKTLNEIATILGYSCTWIKDQCSDAKSVAAEIFGIRPELNMKLKTKLITDKRKKYLQSYYARKCAENPEYFPNGVKRKKPYKGTS